MEIVVTLFALVVGASIVYTGLSFYSAVPPLEEFSNESQDDLSRLLAAVKEIEFDHAAGKLSDVEFEQLKKRYYQEIAILNREAAK
jgi:hypothetical protein